MHDPSFLQVLGQCLAWFLAALAVVLLFSLTILVHEGGHFLAARWLGLEADVFAIGFGPALWKKKAGRTEYRFNAIPFGGYVSLPQLDPAGMAAIQAGGKGKGKEADAPAVPPAAWWKRVVVAAAGPFGNLVFAVLLALLVWALPPVVPEGLEFGGAVVGEVVAERAADGSADSAMFLIYPPESSNVFARNAQSISSSTGADGGIMRR